MTGIRLLWVSVLFYTLAVATPGQACPIGSYEWVDSWGNSVCKRLDDDSTATVKNPSGPSGCPIGRYLWVDSWGNRVCRGDDGDAYDTSRGCPIGSYPWVDSWGNRTCRFN